MFVVKNKVRGVRRGVLPTPHGDIDTPAFMPIATRGAVRVASFSDMKKLGASVILSNTYHLITKPGADNVAMLGGLHSFIGWDGPILTDSGGFQVFSLASLRKISDQGVKFKSSLDGSEIFLSPENVIEAQNKFGSDISMVLDEVCALPATNGEMERAIARTTAWAARAKEKFEELSSRSLLFGIVQGGIDEKLREKSAADLKKIGFDGYAIGGLSVGEESKDMYRVAGFTAEMLPEDKPRYLMGVGQPEDIVEAVRRGVDMFDCVLPTRNARHALLYSDLNEEYLKEILDADLSEPVEQEKLYKKINIRNKQYAFDRRLVNEKCDMLQGVSFAYLRHLFQSQEPLCLHLAALNNIWFYLNLMQKIREEIKKPA